MPVVTSTERLYTVTEAAQELGCSPDAVRRWCRLGRLASFKVGPTGMYRIRVEDLRAFVAVTS